MNPLPCKDCITLPICRSIFKDNSLVFDWGEGRKALIRKCSIIDRYLDPPFSKKSIVSLRIDALNAFMEYGKIPNEKYL